VSDSRGTGHARARCDHHEIGNSRFTDGANWPIMPKMSLPHAEKAGARRALATAVMRAVVLALACAMPIPAAAAQTAPAFAWNRDQLFRSLEQQFEQARQQPLDAVRRDFESLAASHRRALAAVRAGGPKIPLGALQALEQTQFRLAALAAAHEPLLAAAHGLVTETRLVIGEAALNWPVERADVHEAVYRVVFGGRAAIEEALVQQRAAALPALTPLADSPSAAPSTIIEGVRVHSGDIILSRGDAPTSALIARGNPFPGNFSHVAIVYVEPESGKATVVESLIEKGVVITSAENFLKEKRYRLLLLRLRPEHPALRADPLAAHRAASAIFHYARAAHVPYDFSMDWTDASRMFCSEVVHYAYRSAGIDVWAHQAQLTSPGLVRWLGDMGVTQFATLVPSDLEYDPRLAPVAEWRNSEALLLDRLDNVTLDVLLEGAERGDRLGFDPLVFLPGGLVKLWSGFQSALGATPTIPAGMSIETALRARSLNDTVHPRLRTAIGNAAEQFRTQRGYPPPYWTLTDLARRALAALRSSLSPELTASTEVP
jgi:hypothetical protein